MAQSERGGPRLLAKSADASPANFAQRAAWIWTELPVPVIAAVHGVAYGGGLQIALAADLRLVAPDARLSVMEIKWGLVPDMSGTQTLRRLVRLDVAKDLTFTGRVVSGEEAVSIGLATRVAADPRAAALELAAEIAEKSPDAIRAGKQLLDRSGVASVAEGLALEESLQRGLIGGANQIEAVRANMERRPPRFADPR
jgi:enoyl-CoA hydratase/carnithine racemase